MHHLRRVLLLLIVDAIAYTGQLMQMFKNIEMLKMY